MKKFASLLAAAALAVGCAKVDDSVIRVGEYGAMTGEIATFGTSTHEGLMLAIEEANAKGGVNDKQLKLISEDDRGKPEEAALVVEKLISKDKVHALIGEVASSNSLAAAPIAQRHGVPMISPSSTNPKVTQQGDHIFRVCFIDPFQGKVMAKFATETLKAKKAAILRDQKSDYSMGLADVFGREFNAMGGKVVDDKSYTAGDVDFKAQLTALRELKPDVVFVPGYYGEVGLIAKQAKQLGLKAPLLGGDGWDSEKLFEIGGAALDGNYYSNHTANDSKEPLVVAFVKKYQDKYKKTPDVLAMLGYDAGGVLVDSLKRSKSLRGSDLREAIAATKGFVGVTGKITLDVERNAVKSAVVMRIGKGKAAYVATVNP